MHRDHFDLHVEICEGNWGLASYLDISQLLLEKLWLRHMSDTYLLMTSWCSSATIAITIFVESIVERMERINAEDAKRCPFRWLLLYACKLGVICPHSDISAGPLWGDTILSCLQMLGHVETRWKEMSKNCALETHILWTLEVFVDNFGLFWTYQDVRTLGVSGQNCGQMSGTRTCRSRTNDTTHAKKVLGN